MPINPGSIRIGHCYATAVNDVRLVLEITGEDVTYVIRGKLAFPSWDQATWRPTTRLAFSREVTGEVPCDCQPV